MHQRISNHATYLDAQTRAFRDLKHDAIWVRSENNHDLRDSTAIEHVELRRNGAPPPDRRKTIIGQKLRVMIVEKGFLKETEVVQRMVDGLCECQVRVCFLSSPNLLILSCCSSISIIWTTG